MIPTGYRTKIPSTLSYPLGAEAISEALEGVPQTGFLVVDFWYWNRQRLVPIFSQPYRVLSVSYWQAPLNTVYRKLYIESGRFEPGWKITVEPVPRRLRHTVQTRLLTEALPRMRRWLIASQNAEGRTGGHNLVFLYDEPADELKAEENSTPEWNTVRGD
ncbi:MAG TPA: hypothetical protein VN893_20625 [Bryobacteraceae bacterium]|nr:hypothetical protein [Bryobacteraceae bacterium]